jgi:hypothetical protein
MKDRIRSMMPNGITGLERVKWLTIVRLKKCQWGNSEELGLREKHVKKAPL